MMEIGKTFQFSSGHVLWRDDWDEEKNIKVFDKCSRSHGHNYSLTVAISGDVEMETGMIMNYYQLTDIVNHLFIDEWDHRVLNNIKPFSEGILPTAENMVLVALKALKAQFALSIWRPSRIHIKETDKTYAEWRFSD
jgi:6-pyruvoyltetrahydropterin/6-carboxytetrahydropterin synthase